MADSTNANPAKAPGRGRRRLLTVVAAVLAATATYYVETALLGLDLAAPAMGGQASTTITVANVLIAAIVASLLAWLLAAVLDRIGPRVSRPIWTVIAVIVFLGSLAGPFGGSGVDTSIRIGLAAMHTVVAAILIPLIPDWRRSSDREPVAAA